jgi:hypothetical protein
MYKDNSVKMLKTNNICNLNKIPGKGVSEGVNLKVWE